jgi:hypothetical protein
MRIVRSFRPDAERQVTALRKLLEASPTPASATVVETPELVSPDRSHAASVVADENEVPAPDRGQSYRDYPPTAAIEELWPAAAVPVKATGEEQ